MPTQQELIEYQSFSSGATILGESRQWFAVHTRSRYEKRVAAQLGEKQIDSFLPTLKETHHWSDRRKVVDQPLFPGYVFVHMPAEDSMRVLVLRTNGVVGFVGVQGRGIPIPDGEIENVQRLLSSEIQFGVHPFLRIGQRVRVRGGYLDGIEGILVAKNTDQSVVISVELIQRSLSIRVSGFELEAIGGRTISPADAEPCRTQTFNSKFYPREN